MDFNEYHQLVAQKTDFYRDLDAQYKKMFEDPGGSSPKVILNVPFDDPHSWEEQIADPAVMLRTELEKLKNHALIGDDHVPTVRVQLGTGIIASAFGCGIKIMEDNLPCVCSHVLHGDVDIRKLETPSFDAGWLTKLDGYTEYFLENIPEGVHIQLPDIQSPFNTAHLIRGDEVFMDFYDAPETVELLLDAVTDFMIELVPRLNKQIGAGNGWFYDWGVLWKGNARLSNCSAHMISSEFYKEHVYPRDRRFLEAIGGGRIHYCGTSEEVIDEFFNIPNLSGLDFDPDIHDLWDLCDQTPAHVPLLFAKGVGAGSDTGQRLLSGDWPLKKNIIVMFEADSVEEGRELLAELRK